MKRLVFLIAIVVCLIIINHLARSIYDLWSKQDLVVKAKKDLEQERKENLELKKRLEYVKTNQFIEEEARNQLFLVKPGEAGVIIPKDLLATKSSKKVVIPVWQQWVDLFLGR